MRRSRGGAIPIAPIVVFTRHQPGPLSAAGGLASYSTGYLQPGRSPARPRRQLYADLEQLASARRGGLAVGCNPGRSVRNLPP